MKITALWLLHVGKYKKAKNNETLTSNIQPLLFTMRVYSWIDC